MESVSILSHWTKKKLLKVSRFVYIQISTSVWAYVLMRLVSVDCPQHRLLLPCGHHLQNQRRGPRTPSRPWPHHKLDPANFFGHEYLVRISDGRFE